MFVCLYCVYFTPSTSHRESAMEFTTMRSLWGLRVNVVLLQWFLCLFTQMGQYHTPCLGSWTVGTGDLGRKDTNLALGFYIMVLSFFQGVKCFLRLWWMDARIPCGQRLIVERSEVKAHCHGLFLGLSYREESASIWITFRPPVLRALFEVNFNVVGVHVKCYCVRVQRLIWLTGYRAIEDIFTDRYMALFAWQRPWSFEDDDQGCCSVQCIWECPCCLKVFGLAVNFTYFLNFTHLVISTTTIRRSLLLTLHTHQIFVKVCQPYFRLRRYSV